MQTLQSHATTFVIVNTGRYHCACAEAAHGDMRRSQFNPNFSKMAHAQKQFNPRPFLRLKQRTSERETEPEIGRERERGRER